MHQSCRQWRVWWCVEGRTLRRCFQIPWRLNHSYSVSLQPSATISLVDNDSLYQQIESYVTHALNDGPLADRVWHVLSALPREVVADFLADPQFRIAVDDYEPGKGRTVWLACPTIGNGSRSVILKPRLAECDAAFAYYIIAHELAHAHLRNGGYGAITDPEHAADALAAEWGFGKVVRR